MKPLFKTSLLISACCLFIFLTMNSCRDKIKDEISHVEFMNPPESSRIYTWWHWMDNAITKEGITRDLEAMKAQGIAGATILNVGLFGERDMGVPQVIFGTEEWYDMFKWAVQEANRLGIEIGTHNCDGWSTSGGPWITPEMSMKQYIWSKTYIKGGQPIDTAIAEPSGMMDYYEDAAVIAYPAEDVPNSFQLFNPQIRINDTIDGKILFDGNPFSHVMMGNNLSIDISFKQAFVAEQIAVHLRMASSWGSLKDIRCLFEIKASEDGKHYEHVSDLETNGVNKNIITEIPQTRAKNFRIELKKHSEMPYYTRISLSEIELLKKQEKPLYSPSFMYHLEKTASTRPVELKDIFVSDSVSDKAVPVESASVIDLSENLNAYGHLKWDAPEGNWIIIRFGYTTTGVQNAPATNAGRGLECDKMDTAALNLHFNSYPEKLIKAAGSDAGNTFKYLFIDSWECNFQNWTEKFPEEFAKRRGYSLIPWIPVLCGEMENNTVETEAFLHDFRKTIAELIEQNYYKHFSELCHQEGMDLHAEVIYGGVHYPPLDILRSNSHVDFPMWEFWTEQDKEGFVHYIPVQHTSFDKPMFASVVYDKPVVPSEAYTGFAHYSESPWDLKLFGDRAYCSGVNRMVLHSYVHQPTERKPGMTLGQFASHFNRHNLWWPHVSDWFTYQARIQYVLQKGRVVSDILYFIGDLLPEYQKYNDLYILPYGHHFQLCNTDILMNHTEIEDGRIKLKNGPVYQILLLPDNNLMEYSTLQRIATLIENGATVIGPKPSGVLSNKDRDHNNSELEKLANEIWGDIDGKINTEHAYGKGKVIWGESLKDILYNRNIQPDFECVKEDSVNLLFIHKKIGDKDIYFIVNQEDKAIQAECIFRVSGKSPEIWNPQYGISSSRAVYLEEEGRIRMPVRFKPKESLFFVFTESIPEEHIIAVQLDGKQIFPLQQTADASLYIPEVTYEGGNIRILSDLPGEYTFQSNLGREYRVSTEGNEEYEIKDFAGMICFENDSGSIKPAGISDFKYWSEFEDPDIKYYSGMARYHIDFSLPEGFVNEEDSFILSVGGIKATGDVVLNGSKLGYVWMPGQQLDISGLLTQGGNELEVTVANVYRNRLIGDLVQFDEIKSLWTTSPVRQFLNKDMPLQESGIAGPIIITKIKPVNIDFAE
jgi:hypothetical protein